MEVENPSQEVGGEGYFTIAVVAPSWLQDALEVMLEGTAGVRQIASASDVDSLVMLELESAPDFVILDANRRDEVAILEVRLLLTTWPKADCIVLVDDSRQISLTKGAGASLTLLKGASPQRLREVLQALAESRRGNRLGTPETRSAGQSTRP